MNANDCYVFILCIDVIMLALMDYRCLVLQNHIPAGTGFNNLYSNLYDDNSTLKPISKIPKLTEVSTKNKNPLDLDDIILDDRTARILNDS